MADAVFYELFNREERLRRIGALFSKAVTFLSAREDMNAEIPSSVSAASILIATTEGPLKSNSLQESNLAPLKRFAMLGEFSPREATQFWGISRTSAYRRLRNLDQAGWIARNGNTSAVRYRLTTKAQSILKQLKQATSGTMNMALAISPQLHECLTSGSEQHLCNTQ